MFSQGSEIYDFRLAREVIITYRTPVSTLFSGFREKSG